MSQTAPALGPDMGVVDVVNPAKHERRSDWSQRLGSRELPPLIVIGDKPGVREWFHVTDSKTGPLPDIVSAVRSYRHDPLARMHAHHDISDVQLLAGRAYQALLQASSLTKLGSSGDIREHVDGTPPRADPINDRQQAAKKRLDAIDAKLGTNKVIVRNILEDKWTIAKTALEHGRSDRMMREWIGKRFRECLTTLAKELGYGG